MTQTVLIRTARADDISVLQKLIELSVRGLQVDDYTSEQLDRALASVYGVDTQLIADSTYFVAELSSADARDELPIGLNGEVRKGDRLIIGCGGWSARKTLYGADHCAGRVDELLDPAKDAAKIRAFFILPNWARRGIGTLILKRCEDAAKAAGFKRLEMGATLSGVPFYKAKGYAELEHLNVPLGETHLLPIVRMAKDI
jgi:GNAT superfamily N-acetyltransferase